MNSNSENLKKRNIVSPEDEEKLLEKIYENYENDDDDDEDLPYGGKVYLARKRKPDSWPCIAFQVFLVIGVFGFLYYAYYYFEHMHINVLKGYAHLGFDTAQHELANRYLHGVGIDKDHNAAMQWFKKAAEQGHPHASYNLAVGHLKGMNAQINQSEAKRLIEHAANNGVHEAVHTLTNICVNGGCD